MIDRDRALIEREAVRPIIGIENRTPQEVFEIMSDRIARLSAARDEGRAEGLGGEWVMVPRARLHEIIVDVLDSWHDGMRRRKADDILKAIPAPPASQTQEG